MASELEGTTALIELRELTAGYRLAAILAHLSLRIGRGAFVGVVGPTGSGKTTLLKAIMGLVPAASGEVRIDGRTLDALPKGYLAYVPQHGDVDPFFPITLEQVMLLGLTAERRWLPWPSREQRRRVQALAERLGILTYLHHHIADVSGGQRQRAFLGRALLCAPKLLILDEPTAGVDMDTQHDILHLLGELNRSGVTIVMTTHDLNAVALSLPQVVCFNRGLIAQGRPESVFTDQVLQRTFGENLTTVRHDGRLMVAAKEPLRF